MSPEQQLILTNIFEKVAIKVFKEIPDGEPLPCTKHGIGKPKITRKLKRKKFS